MTRKALITKTFSFDAAHQLPNHKGKCCNLHGHSYSCEVAVYDSILETSDGIPSSEGMVLDYSSLKNIVKPFIDDMDHSFLCDENQFKQLVSGNSPFGKTKLYMIGKRTTAENIAWHLFDELYKQLGSSLEYVKVQETASSSSVVYAKDYVEHVEGK